MTRNRMAWVPVGTIVLLVLALAGASPLVAQNHFLHFVEAQDYVSLGMVPLGGLTEVTIEAWVYNESNAANAGKIYRQGQEWWKVLDIGIADDGLLAVAIGFNTLQAATYHTAVGAVAHDAWQHLAVVFDGSGLTTLDKVKVYLGGVELALSVASELGGGPPSMAPDLGTLEAFLAREANNSRYVGYMDEVRIWNVARTQAEIVANMDMPLVGNEAGLLAYYDFEQGTCGGNNAGETTLIDRSPNGQDGTLLAFDLDNCQSNWVCDAPPCNAPGFSVPVELQTFSIE